MTSNNDAESNSIFVTRHYVISQITYIHARPGYNAIRKSNNNNKDTLKGTQLYWGNLLQNYARYFSRLWGLIHNSKTLLVGIKILKLFRLKP